jgi:thiamine-phosphate pyrophosphorylase
VDSLKKKNFKIYCFTNKINNNLKKKLLKYSNRNIIYINHKNISDILEIKKFCKKEKINLFISDNVNLAKRLNINNLHLSATNKKKVYLNHKNVNIIGTVHSQLEFHFKLKQGCSAVFLSPIFKTEKYSENKVLDILKFNQIIKDWRIPVYALAGINQINLKRLKLANVCGCGGVSYFKEKDPPL